MDTHISTAWEKESCPALQPSCGFPNAIALYLCQPNEWRRQSYISFASFCPSSFLPSSLLLFLSKSFILRCSWKRQYLCEHFSLWLQYDPVWCRFSINVLWALAWEPACSRSRMWDTYHRHAVCSLKVKLYQRYLHLMRWLHLSVIAIKTFMSSSNTFRSAPGCIALGMKSYPSQRSANNCIKKAWWSMLAP